MTKISESHESGNKKRLQTPTRKLKVSVSYESGNKNKIKIARGRPRWVFGRPKRAKQANRRGSKNVPKEVIIIEPGHSWLPFGALLSSWTHFFRFWLHLGFILDPFRAYFGLILDIWNGQYPVGMLGCWVVGLLDCWVVGLLGLWFVGLFFCWSVGLLVGWSVGILVCWILDSARRNARSD